MTSNIAWDEIDTTLLGIAKSGPTLAELIAQSGMVDAEIVVKDLVHAYVRGGWLAPVPFSPCFQLTVAGHAKLNDLRQGCNPGQLSKAA